MLQAQRGVVTLRPAQPVEQCTPALTAVPGPQQELGGVAVERPMRHLTAAPRGAHPDDEQALSTTLLTTRHITGSPKSPVPKDQS
ncbi:hypothetical protein ACFYR1_03260 [Streptomyces canus]|uniref:hypothetical protein n=1 Tax=Streptomyces canus TaxID=58343 RepID=UPI0036B84995